MYDVYKSNFEENGTVDDYIGLWYSGQMEPQPIHLTLDGYDETVAIDEYGEIGHGSQTCRSFNGLDLVLRLPVSVCTIEEVEALIEEIKPITDALFKSHKVFYDGQRYIGRWDESLKMELWDKIDRFESELYFDSELMWQAQ